MKHDSLTSVMIFFLVSCGLYAIYYSIQLVCLPNDFSKLDHGFRLRGSPPTYENITQVMIITEEESLGGAITLMSSIVQNTKGQVYFFLATDNDTMNHLWAWIEGTKLKSISYEIKGLTKAWIKKRINKEGSIKEMLSYSRILTSEIFPNLKRRVIILDDDTLVLGDISQLERMPLLEHHIGATAFDCDTVSRRYNYKGSRYGNVMQMFKEPLKSKHMDPNTCTFNLGVTLFDTKRWKDRNVTQEVLALMLENQKNTIFNEDDILYPLLVSLYNKTEELNPLWHVRNIGVTSGARYDRAFIKKAKLLHWNGPFKPWKHSSPFSDIWDKYYIADPTGKFSLPRVLSVNTL